MTHYEVTVEMRTWKTYAMEAENEEAVADIVWNGVEELHELRDWRDGDGAIIEVKEVKDEDRRGHGRPMREI